MVFSVLSDTVQQVHWGMTNYPIGPQQTQLGPPRTPPDQIQSYQTTIYIILTLHITLRMGPPICRQDSFRYAYSNIKFYFTYDYTKDQCYIYFTGLLWLFIDILWKFFKV